MCGIPVRNPGAESRERERWTIIGLLFFSLLASPSLHAEWTNIFLCPPSRTENVSSDINNTSYAYPFPFNAYKVNAKVQNEWRSNRSVRLYFVPGVYQISPWWLPSPVPNRSSWLALIGTNNVPGSLERAVLQCKVNLNYNKTELRFIKTATPLDYLEIRDLDLDGNWPAWAAADTPANPTWTKGFKINALFVEAYKGIVSGVHVYNCGANGRTPLPYWQSQGVEAFPLYIKAYDYAHNLRSNNSDPLWIIEDCEVSDFYSYHGGYCTAIMAVVRVVNSNDIVPDYRAVIVRRCQVEGNPNVIAYGSAHSPGIRYEDNVTTYASLGINHDTAILQYIDIVDSVFLDVQALGNIGAVGWKNAFHDYQISGNLIRLRGIPLLQNYRYYNWTSITIDGSKIFIPKNDPSVDIGRFQDGYCVGIKLGGANNITFSDNWFTTRPIESFYEPDPSQIDQAKWTPVWRPTTDPYSGRSYDQTGTVTVSDLLLSANAIDFGVMNPISDPVSESDKTIEALSTTNGQFAVVSWPGRVAMEFSDEGDSSDNRRLVSVREVQIAKPIINGNQITLQARVVRHYLPSSGTGGTFVDSERANYLILLALSPYGETLWEMDPEVQNGIATFTFSLQGNQWIKCVVYEGPYFNPHNTDWSWTEISSGQVVRFDRAPDVADDSRLHPATLRLVRTDPNGSLKVTIRPLIGGVVRPATPEVDYHLQVESGGSLQWDSENGVYLFWFDDGTTNATLKAVPLAGLAGNGKPDVIEEEAAWFQIETDPNGTYAIAPPRQGTTAQDLMVGLTFWDGPEFRLHLLSDYVECGSSGGGEIMAASTPNQEALTLQKGNELSLLSPQLKDLLAQRMGWDLEAIPSLEETTSTSQATGLELGTRGSIQTTEDGTVILYARKTFAYDICTAPEGYHYIAGYAYYYNDYYPSECWEYGQEFELSGWWTVPDYYLYMNKATLADWVSRAYGTDSEGTVVGTHGYNVDRAKPYAFDINSETFHWLPSLVNYEPGEARKVAKGATLEIAVGWADSDASSTILQKPVLWIRDENGWQASPVDLENGESTEGIANDLIFEKDENGTLTDVALICGETFQQDSHQAVRWKYDPSSGNVSKILLSFPEDPNTPPYLNANIAYAIAENKDIVGCTDTRVKRNGSYNVEQWACIWQWKSDSESYKKAQVLGPLYPKPSDPSWQGNFGKAYGIALDKSDPSKIQRIIVGTANNIKDSEELHAFINIKISGPMLDLNDPYLTLLPDESWLLEAATGIVIDADGRKWIIGNGTHQGMPTAWVLEEQPKEEN